MAVERTSRRAFLRRLAGVALLSGLTACGSGRPRRRGGSPPPPSASRVVVQLQASGRGLEDFRANLEAAMDRRYRRAGSVDFRRIKFIIEGVDPDPYNARDLVLRGRLVVVTFQGTEHRPIERRIPGSARARPANWAGEVVDSLLPAIDYQLRRLQ